MSDLPTLDQLYDEVYSEVFDPEWIKRVAPAYAFRLKATCRDIELAVADAAGGGRSRRITARRGVILLSRPRSEVGRGGWIDIRLDGTYEWRTGSYQLWVPVFRDREDVRRGSVGPNHQRWDRLGSLIYLRAKPLTGFRVDLKAFCSSQVVQGYFLHLLDNVTERFPKLKVETPGEYLREIDAGGGVPAQEGSPERVDAGYPVDSQDKREVGDETEGDWRAEPEKDSTALRTGGRPRNEDDLWAWREVNEKGRSRAAVYSEWLRRIGARQKTLADPHDSFKKAVRAGKMRPKGPNAVVRRAGEG